jgi:hypothetical protein
MFANRMGAKTMRRAGIVAATMSLVVAPLMLAAGAWQGPEWQPGVTWSDGRQIEWRATPARGCDGSNVELRLVNRSQSSGEAALKDITFQCKRGSPPFIAPERTMSQVAPGGTATAPVINCACPERGGVISLVSIGIDMKRNGAGVETLSNGCTYTGNFLNGQRHGQGVYACPNGYVYEGGYQMGQLNGRGAETLESGERYEGDFVMGVRSGVGRMTFTDGSVYEGGYLNGKRNGEGTQRFADGSRYIGEWKDDRRDGQGVYTSGDGQWTFDGTWVNDKRQGQGKMAEVSGAYTYIGPYVNDQRHGPAVVQFGDGSVFRGPFVNDVQRGPGELTFKDGRKITGEFLDHMPNGQAVEQSNAGTLNGVWSNGMLNGKVLVTYPNGTRFEGMYASNKRHGIGTDFLSDGSREECNWVNDVRQSPCVRITPDGKRIEYKAPPARRN